MVTIPVNTWTERQKYLDISFCFLSQEINVSVLTDNSIVLEVPFCGIIMVISLSLPHTSILFSPLFFSDKAFSKISCLTFQWCSKFFQFASVIFDNVTADGEYSTDKQTSELHPPMFMSRRVYYSGTPIMALSELKWTFLTFCSV